MPSQPSDSAGAERHFDRGLFDLDRYLFHFEFAALPRAVAAFRMATGLAPDEAGYWAALGFTLDASDLPAEALVVLRRANEVEPEDEVVEVFVLTLMSELGLEDEALAAVEALASRKDVDLDSVRQGLTDADMPADARALLMNGFLRARNFLRSRLQDAIDRFQRTHDPAEWARQEEAEQRECFERQEALQRDFDPDRVPDELSEVTPWAIRLGVGDDVCRGRLVESLTAGERTTLHGLIREHATSIHSWLDTFGGKPMTSEAAAFMYLLLGTGETNPSRS